MNRIRNVLVIEDEAGLRRSMVAYLEDCGYLVRGAENGRMGVEAFAAQAPDIVLTDLRMPEMNGMEVAAWVRRRSAHTPVIIITGTGDQNAIDTALAAGARMCLAKPINDLAELELAIRQCLD